MEDMKEMEEDDTIEDNSWLSNAIYSDEDYNDREVANGRIYLATESY